MVLTAVRSNSWQKLLAALDAVPVAGSFVRRRRAPERAFRFSGAQRQAIVTAYEAGATMTSWAKQYDVRRTTISKLLHKAGAEIRLRRAMSQAEIDQAVQLYAHGVPLQRIGEQLGWDHNTIYRQLKKRGVVFRGPNDWQFST